MLPLVVTVRSAGGEPRRYAFAESPVSIGRSPFAELQLTEPFVSRWEGTLRFDEREVTYFVLGSTNPTYVDGRPITEREQDLAIGLDSVLAIGELELRFSRERVAEADIRHKGKRRPPQDDREVAVKTMYLDGAALLQAHGAAARAPSREPAAPAELAHAPAPQTGGLGGAGSEGPATAESTLSNVLPMSHGGYHAEQGRSGTEHAAPSLPEPTASESIDPEARLPELYRGYRKAADELVGAFVSLLESTTPERRVALAERLQRRYPRALVEPEFRAALRRLALPITRSEVPEVRDWLLSIGRDVLPAKLQLDTGLTLERIFRLLEILTQSLAEINHAQDSVRSRWLGRTPRRSVLRSENGRVVLAYLLNPKADFAERVAELEQTIREAVTHELALFKAVLDGAGKLVAALAPDAVERAEQQASSSTPESAAKPWWPRLRGGGAPEARLWRRLVAMHGELVDGDRHQRLFLGRAFAQSYLAAMGQPDEPASDRGAEPAPTRSTRGVGG